MAFMPCDIGNHRYAKKLVYAYFALLDGPDTVRERLKLCPYHWSYVTDSPETPWCEVDEADTTIPSPDSCVVCKRERVPGSYGCFLTAYPEGTRHDWYGMCCPTCAETVRGLGAVAFLNAATSA